MKKILSLILLILSAFVFSTSALAAPTLNDNEKELYLFIENGIEVFGQSYSPLSRYKNEFLNYLSRNYVDLSKDQTDEAISAISEIYKYMSSNNLNSASIIKENKISLSKLSFRDKKKIIENGVKAASACELVLSYEQDTDTIIITDKYGKDVYRNDDVIKATGSQLNLTPFAYTTIFIIISGTTAIFVRKRFFA